MRDTAADMAEVAARHVDDGVGGVAWLVDHGGTVATGASGTLDAVTGGPPVTDTSLFRIASLTKPMVAAATLALVADGRLALGDAVDDLLPELAHRQVLRDPTGPVDGPTVPVTRPITVGDLLTQRLGDGMDFAATSQPVLDQMGEWGIGPGPCAPDVGPDEYLARLGSLPLTAQPGERWLYHTASDVLGVLLERRCGTGLDTILGEWVLGPLGMGDTSFWVPPEHAGRFGTCRMPDESGIHQPWDDPRTGRWSAPPAFRSGATGLVSTVGDLHRFARMLADGGIARGTDGSGVSGGGVSGGGVPAGGRVLPADLVEALTSNQLTDSQVDAAAIDEVRTGWSLGLGVALEHGPMGAAGTYGWDGGLGTTWRTDPSLDLIVVACSTDSFAGPSIPAVLADLVVTARRSASQFGQVSQAGDAGPVGGAGAVGGAGGGGVVGEAGEVEQVGQTDR